MVGHLRGDIRHKWEASDVREDIRSKGKTSGAKWDHHE